MIKAKIHPERIKWIDSGRGIGLLLVILGHLVTAGTPIANWIFSFHIPLFFFLSGYVSKFETSNLRYSLKRIGINLVIPYFIFVIIGLIVSFAIPVWRPTSFKTVIIDVFYNVTPESLHVGQIWFLFCLAVVQVFFLIFIKLNLKNKFLIAASVASFTLIAYLINSYNIGVQLNGTHFRLPWKIDSAFMGLFFFSLGYYSKLLHLFSKIFLKITTINILLMTIALVISIYVSVNLNNNVNLGGNFYGNLIYFIIASFSGIIFIAYASKMLENNFTISYMGRNALPIFSSHSFFLYLYAFLISSIFGRGFTIMSNIPLFLCLIGLILVSLISLMVPIIYNNTIQKLVLKLK